jgi:hypothetical protein
VPLPSGKVPQMNCRDFEKSFDEYVDGALPPPLAARCVAHVSMCPPCEQEVTRWQQTRNLLSTAVAEVATAVDVSALWKDVEAALDRDGSASDREPSFVRGEESKREGRGARRSASGASKRGAGFAAAAWRFGSAAGASALAAAAAVVFLVPGPASMTATGTVGKERTVLASYSPPKKLIRRVSNGVSPAAYHPGGSNAPQPRAASYIDNLEAPQGHLVSTWVQPRTNVRVIWVEDRGTGGPVRTADYRR